MARFIPVRRVGVCNLSMQIVFDLVQIRLIPLGERRFRMRAKVHPEICIGCGLCAGVCSTVFRMEGDKAIVIIEIVPAGSFTACRQAAEDCPVLAIEIKEP